MHLAMCFIRKFSCKCATCLIVFIAKTSPFSLVHIFHVL